MTEFIFEIRVRYSEMDAMKVAYYANYFKWFEVGRAELLRTIGYPYAQLELAGIWLPIVECNAKYRSPAFYDDLLEISTVISECLPDRITFTYAIRRKETGKLLCTGFSKHPITNTSMRRINLKIENLGLYERIQSIL